MSYTFFRLTNDLLKDLNEVEIPVTDWASVRGVQATAKDSVLRSIAHIQTHNDQWPFNYQDGSLTLVKGQTLYAEPLNSNIDYNSFYIEKDDALNVNTKRLIEISEDIWSRDFRQKDYDVGSEGLDVPYFVFPASGNKIGVSPSPNNTYSIKYQYYTVPTEMSAYTDVTTIPERFMRVVNQGARMYFYMFYDNSEQSNLEEKRFNLSLSKMTRTLITKKQVDLYDTRVNFGGYING